MAEGRLPRKALSYYRDLIREGLAIGCSPVAMASPPTIGAFGSSATITGRGVYGVGDPALTFLAANWYRPSNAFAKATTADISGTGAAFANASGTNRRASSANVPFVTDGPNFEIRAVFTKMRLMVLNQLTGKWEIAATITGGAGGSTQQYIPVDFGSAAPKGRICKIEADASVTLYSIAVGPTYGIWKYQPRIPLSAIVIADSYGEGAGATHQFDGEYMQLGYLLGIDNWRISASGGTGLVQTNTNNSAVSYIDRLVADVINQGPFDLVIVHGTKNDAGKAGISTALTSLLSQIDAAMPDALQIVMSAWTARTNDTGSLGVTADMVAALTARNNPNRTKYLDKTTWITGTGNVGATVGDGNADRYVNNDGIHRSQAGHDFDAANMAQAFASLVA